MASHDYTDAVTWLFVSLEAAIAALAAQHGVSIEPTHWRKAQAAEQLYAQGATPSNFAPALRTLNEARKEAVYDGEDPDFGEQSLEELASEVESAVDLAVRGSS